MVSLFEAGQRLDPLMSDSSELASFDELKRVFEWQPNRRGRNLLVWLIHNRILHLFDGGGKAVGVEVTEEARAFFRLYVPKPGRHWKRNGFDGFDEHDEAETYLDNQEFGWLFDFLGSEPTLFLDCQLAYRWAGLAMPSARVWGLRQRDPDDFPPQVRQRLAWIRQFSSGRKHEPDPPLSLPSG
ncbi:MAG: hypothetical protein FIA97_20410 [Methylococcaceae bacterium]|nr:hypothetical protein [Methylococcaceae bacterium]